MNRLHVILIGHSSKPAKDVRLTKTVIFSLVKECRLMIGVAGLSVPTESTFQIAKTVEHVCLPQTVVDFFIQAVRFNVSCTRTVVKF